MNLSILSIEKWSYQFAEFCIEWFMNFFADPEYYWTSETYPGAEQQTVSINKTKIEKVKKNIIVVFKKQIVRFLSGVKLSNLVDFRLANYRKTKSDFLLFYSLTVKNFRAFRVFSC